MIGKRVHGPLSAVALVCCLWGCASWQSVGGGVNAGGAVENASVQRTLSRGGQVRITLQDGTVVVGRILSLSADELVLDVARDHQTVDVGARAGQVLDGRGHESVVISTSAVVSIEKRDRTRTYVVIAGATIVAGLLVYTIVRSVKDLGGEN
jgi:hypothetical protein